MRTLLNRLSIHWHDSFIWAMQSWQRDKYSAAFIRHHTEAMHEVLDACERLKLKFWAIEGTLIALLRYGHIGVPDLVSSIDDDIDLMVVHSSHEDWKHSALKLRETLREQGWEDAFKAGPLLSTSDVPGSRWDKLKLRKFSPDSRRVWTHLDLHSSLLTQSTDQLVSHDTPTDYPFQKWTGRLPANWVFPLRNARYNNQTCPVPQKAIEILARWNDGEYDEKNLLYPLRSIDEKERREIDHSVRELDQAGYASFAPLLPSESR